MLHAGLDLSRRRLDVCLVDDAGELVAQLAAAPDTDGLRHLARRVAARVRAVIESMNGARFVHDTRSHRGSPAVRSNARARITRAALTSALSDHPRARHRNRAWLSRDAASTALQTEHVLLVWCGSISTSIDPYHVSCSCDSALSSCAGRIAMRPDRCDRKAASFESRHLL